MAISLNDHESRIKALEEKPTSSFEISKAQNGYMKDASGFMILWQYVSGSGTKNFHKAFPTACVNIIISQLSVPVGGGGDNAGVGAKILSNSQFSVTIDGGASSKNYIIAIGYLITNSIWRVISWL